MRIGRISTRIFPDIGGPANHVFHLSLALGKMGVQNSIISCAPLSKCNLQANVQLNSLPFPAPKKDANRLTHIVFSLSFLIVGLFWSLIFFIKNRVTIIHAHSPSLSGLLGLAASITLRKPLIFSIHGMLGPKFIWSKESGNYLHLIIEKLVIKHAKGIVVVASDYIPSIKEMATNSIISVIGNGVDTSRFYPLGNLEVRKKMRDRLQLSANTLGLLWVGNFDINEKVAGLVDLIRAMRLILDEGLSDWVLFLVGDGYRINEIRDLVDYLGLTDYVRFLKHRNDVPKVMQSVDIFLLTSHHEGSPNSLLEAMASGLPCIVSRVGGIPEIIGNNDAIVEPSDIVGLSRRITEVITSDLLRQEMSKQNRSRVCSIMSWATIAEKTKNFYLKIA